MGSDSEFSSDGSAHNDSDTIVISSKSRILISPRKKGSKAVSKLLGTAADDVVEQLLRTADGHTDVISRTKHSTVRVRNQEVTVHNDDDIQTTASNDEVGTRSARQTTRRDAPQHRTTVVATEKRVNEARRVNGVNDTSGLSSDHSDLSGSGLSAPSSDEGERTRRRAQRQPLQRSAIGRSTTTTKRDTRTVTHHRTINRDYGSDSGSGAAEELESDASGSTRGSSLSQREKEVRSSGQRKFDDQLQVAAFARRHIPAGRSEPQYDESSTRRTGKRLVKREHTARHTAKSDLDDSVILPTSATQEMEDLKQTLKNLAHQDPMISGPSHSSNKAFLLSDPPRKSASFTGGTRGVNQVRKQEYVQNGYEEAVWTATTSAPDRFEDPITTKRTAKATNRDRRSEDDDYDSDPSGTPIARRLFSTPPQRTSSKLSTPPTVPVSFASKRTPSPHPTGVRASSGFTSMLDTSFTAAASSSAQGSRAVLSALKALQDKIRRLEEEREALMQELSDIKVKLRKREAEFASSEKKFTYELGQTKESARAAYDAIRSEREELKLELVKYEERRKAMEAELHHAHKLTSTFSAKADDLQSQLQSSESQRSGQHAEMEAMRGAHSQEVRDLRAEMLALQKENDAAQEQIKLLQVQLEREAQHHTEVKERLHEAEQTVAGITQLNDKLVAKVWEANEIATKATKKTRKLQQSQRVSTLSRPTAASRAASISAANGPTTPGRSGSTLTKKTRIGSITTKGSASVKKEKRPSQLLGNNNLELLRAANLGRDIPFVLGTSANRSHSIISNVQEALRQCDTTYATPVTNPPPTPTVLKTRKSSAKARKPSISVSDQASLPSRRGTSASILGFERPDAAPTLVGSRTKTPNGSVPDGTESKRPSAIRVPTHSTSYPNPIKSQIMEDLHAAVENAEAEFTALNRKYKDAAARVESGRDGSAQLAKSLGPMLDDLEAKGKQLNLLKQVYEQASQSTINPVRHAIHSPEAVRRKTASLRILNDYRQMERDAKSPRNEALSPESPSGTRTGGSHRASFFSDE